MKVVVFGWFCRNIFSTSSFFGVVDMNSITDAAIINRFLKLLFCNRSWFLDITQSKYIITRQQCLKSPEMLILCEAGQNDLQKCPSLTKCLLNIQYFWINLYVSEKNLFLEVYTNYCLKHGVNMSRRKYNVLSTYTLPEWVSQTVIFIDKRCVCL